ncbi:MAG: hypothetical protein JNM56_08255 [Planctomycetia bacterium]|nr:hypothetical protein [Planctomycetia bacterium]
MFQNEVPYVTCRHEKEHVVALRKNGTWGAPANSGDFFSFVTLSYPNYSQDGAVVTLRRRHCAGRASRGFKELAGINSGPESRFRDQGETY